MEGILWVSITVPIFMGQAIKLLKFEELAVNDPWQGLNVSEVPVK